MTSHTPGPWAAEEGVVVAPNNPIGAQILAEIFEHASGSMSAVRANAELMASAPDLKRKLEIAVKTLKEIADGSQDAGRWLDARGNECGEAEPGARWEEFTLEEQSAWLDSVAGMAQDALREIGVEP